nr:hypothetical protein CFP56_25327 [Quercus suber]
MLDAKEIAPWTFPYAARVLPLYISKEEEKSFSPYDVEVAFFPNSFMAGNLLFPGEVGITFFPGEVETMFYPVSSIVHLSYVLPFENDLVQDRDPFSGKALHPFFGDSLHSF